VLRERGVRQQRRGEWVWKEVYPSWKKVYPSGGGEGGVLQAKAVRGKGRGWRAGVQVMRCCEGFWKGRQHGKGSWWWRLRA
jgi:hypothetical protein